MRVASAYPYVVSASLGDVGDEKAVLALDVAVELPNAARLVGYSDTGVRAVEPVEVVLRDGYPRRCPGFRLRPDFPPATHHLAPGKDKSGPVPCLVDGSPDEFFAQHDLVDAGIMAIVEQMCVWLKRAAIGRLADERSGWEPINRATVLAPVFVDRESLIISRIAKDAGEVWLRSRYLGKLYEVDEETPGFWVSGELAPKIGPDATFPFVFETLREPGQTVTTVLWPNHKAVSDEILADDITTIGQLEARAAIYGMGDQFRRFLRDLERRFETKWTSAPLPVAVILCVRRPFALTGRKSSIELLAYWFKFHRPKAVEPPPALRAAEQVYPLRQVDMPSAVLFRSISNAPEIPKTSVIGCGSVGSKLAMHLARTGASILAVSDNDLLQPHNMARHALARGPFPRFKAPELADELGQIGASPRSYVGNIIPALDKPDELKRFIPMQTELVVNTTASRLVREALVGCAGGKITARVAEVALFGRGDGAFVFVEGKDGNPTLTQLEASLYATVSKRERQLLFDPATGLAQVQIGEGCGSLTMPMDDARLSASTAMATEELTRIVGPDSSSKGQVAIGVRERTGLSTCWRRMTVPAFHRVPVEGGSWTLDVSDDVVNRIRSEIAAYPTVETGGLMIGTCNSRRRVITVVDILPAPADSTRTASLFQLGTAGLKKMVDRRFRESGGSLFDVGTWHSHLAEQGASALDWKTAKSLAEERPPPAVLLICTPTRFLAITGTNGG
nr:ThiF family adenylyltransferase [Aurantimonas endophytica]